MKLDRRKGPRRSTKLERMPALSKLREVGGIIFFISHNFLAVHILYGLIEWDNQLCGVIVSIYLTCLNGTMVEESISSGNKPAKTKTARPKPVYLWSVLDVQKWLRRHCSDYCNLYSENFLQHEITGRALIRVNENTLLRIGIEDSVHRQEIWREIMKLRLKTDIMEIRDLERQNSSI